MTRRWLVAVAVFVASCSDSSGVSPSAKTQIDRLAAEHDCAGLQAFFDATTDRAADQLRYIDDKMRGAGCYDD